MAKKAKVTQSSGNIFDDLGLDLPHEHYVKPAKARHEGRILVDA